MQLIRSFHNFFICFFISEIKSLLNKLRYVRYFLININFFEYFLFLFNRNKFNPIKSKSFKSFIINNKKKWNEKAIHKQKNEIILIENFINQPAYGISNAIIAKFLSKIKHIDQIIGFIREGDIKSEVLFRSFGCKKIIYFKNKNFFLRIKYIFLAIYRTINIYSINDFCKIKKNGIDLGLPAYDSFIRYTGIPSIEKINPQLIFFLAETLYVYDYFNEIINKNKNIKHLIQSETAFSPLNVFFQLSLKKSIKVYSRLGTDKFSIRIYNNLNQKYFYRANISNKLLNEVHNNFASKCYKEIRKYYYNLNKKGFFGQDLRIRKKIKNKFEMINKKKLLKIFNWSPKKKIVVFFLNHLIDVNFHSGPRTIFKDNYTWTKFLLNKITKIKNVNWILKDHPSQPFYKARLNFENKILELSKKYDHINSFNKTWNPLSIKNFSDIAITSHGTAGIEYPSFGINSLYVENSFYSNVNIIKKINNKKILIKKLKNLNKETNLSKNKIKKANTFLYIRYLLLQIKCSLLPEHDTSRQINEEEFWKKSTNLLKKFTFKKDKLYQMFKLQLRLDMRHTIDFKKLKLKKFKYNDLSEN